MKKCKFKKGDYVTYKYVSDLPKRRYERGGDCQGGFKGKITSTPIYNDSVGCFTFSVTVKSYSHSSYSMLESEFVEFNENKIEHYEIF